jgi:hypothetical protein
MADSMLREGFLLSIEVDGVPTMAQQPGGTFHATRQSAATMLAPAAAASTEPELSAAVRIRLRKIARQAEWLTNLSYG